MLNEKELGSNIVHDPLRVQTVRMNDLASRKGGWQIQKLLAEIEGSVNDALTAEQRVEELSEQIDQILEAIGSLKR
ncbi:MAG: hypothetical protein HY424_01790 [Candidatus Levybacteria bacterium]|nr:hypothetical protein [Candidatus Levybacteria bacterium]